MPGCMGKWLRNQTGMFLFLSFTSLLGCRTDFDLYAPYEDIWIVYGVLDPDQDQQGIRISLAFQEQGDVFEYAAELDPSVGGLDVRITGGGHSYQAVWQDSILKDTLSGAFGDYTGAYFFDTIDSLQIQAGEVYTLEIRRPDQPDFFLTAKTRVPPRPRLLSPTVFRIDGQECLPSIPVEDSVRVLLQPNPARTPGNAFAFQLEVNMHYFNDGIPNQVRYGPTRLFKDDVRCQWLGAETICYNFPNGAIFSRLKSAVDNSSAFFYENSPRCVPAFSGFLPEGVDIRAVAVDTIVGRYITVNTPAFRSLNTVIPEYTNLSGTEPAFGIWGSINSSRTPIALSPCAEFRLGITNPVEDPCR